MRCPLPVSFVLCVAACRGGSSGDGDGTTGLPGTGESTSGVATGADLDATEGIDDTTGASTGGVPEPVACGQPGEGFEAGSRLQVRALRPDDGPATFYSFFDGELGVECGIGPTPDGVERCLPLAQYVDERYFADATCSGEPVAVVWAECVTAVTYAQRFTNEACVPFSSRIFELGPVQPGPAYERTEAGTCIELGESNYRTVGAEVPPDTLVAFERETSATDAGLELVHLRGDDGSCLLSGARSAEYGTVWVAPASDDVDRWLPLQYFANTSLWLSPDCSGEHVTESCDPPPSITAYESVGCTTRFTIHEAGAPVDIADVSQGEPGSCAPAMPSALGLYAIGPEIVPDVFAPVVEGSIGRGRLQRRFTGLDADVAVQLGGYWDTELEFECWFSDTVDGGQRCLPFATDMVYADAACTELRARVYEGACAGEPPRHAQRGAPTDSCGGYTVEVFVIGDPAPATTYYSGLPGRCFPSELSPEESLWQVEGPLDPTLFAGGTVSVR